MDQPCEALLASRASRVDYNIALFGHVFFYGVSEFGIGHAILILGLQWGQATNATMSFSRAFSSIPMRLLRWYRERYEGAGDARFPEIYSYSLGVRIDRRHKE